MSCAFATRGTRHTIRARCVALVLLTMWPRELVRWRHFTAQGVHLELGLPMPPAAVVVVLVVVVVGGGAAATAAAAAAVVSVVISSSASSS